MGQRRALKSLLAKTEAEGRSCKDAFGVTLTLVRPAGGHGPDIDVGVLAQHVRVAVMEPVVLVAPVHGTEPGKQREHQMRQQRIADVAIGERAMTALVAEHGRSGGSDRSDGHQNEAGPPGQDDNTHEARCNR